VIKWVNDIYVKDKKIAGILTEGEFDENGNITSYVVGMGINVYKNAELTSNVPIASTLEDASENEIDINRLAAKIIRAVMLDKDHRKTLSEYRERSFVIGRKVKVITMTGNYDAIALSVGDDYSLTVKSLESGEIRSISTGEVSLSVME
jgi:BirA family biotin operon repressor/biotin-[acetyl-CoA-carboxylase] ligase